MNDIVDMYWIHLNIFTDFGIRSESYITHSDNKIISQDDYDNFLSELASERGYGTFEVIGFSHLGTTFKRVAGVTHHD